MGRNGKGGRGSVPDLWRSALTRMFTPPMPSSVTSRFGSDRQEVIHARYLRWVRYSLYPRKIVLSVCEGWEIAREALRTFG